MSSTKDREKKPLTAEERERRRERMRRMKKKKAQRRRLLIAIAIVILIIIVLIGFLVVRLVKGNKGDAEISARGNTFVIALDAGHGGADTGLGNEDIEEKEVTLGIVSKLKVMFENQGYEVVLTRSDDERIAKEERVQKVNGSNADLLVSVHLNFSENSSDSGINTYYKADSAQSELLAEKVLAAAAEETGAVPGKAAEGSFTILNDTEIPAILIEAGYASSMEDSEKLAEDTYRNDMAKGIAIGVIRCLATD